MDSGKTREYQKFVDTLEEFLKDIAPALSDFHKELEEIARFEEKIDAEDCVHKARYRHKEERLL
jgi:flagellar biosynthesis chaperone FliJ